MKTILGIAVCLALISKTAKGSESPEATITNGSIQARLFLPDAKTGFYRGTRFDWSGVIGRLVYQGHDYYPQWFQRTDPKVRDFVYQGTEIVAGPCTAITGPAEEFITEGKALGFDETKAGGTFIKIGVGRLRKPDDTSYDAFRLYEIVDGGKWRITRHPAGVEFEQELSDSSSGYGYSYRKTVSLAPDTPRMVLQHWLKNTGQRVIKTSVYNHNFLFLDRRPPSPDFTIEVPFPIQTQNPAEKSLAEIAGNRITFGRALTGEDRVYLAIQGFGTDPKDYDIRIENRTLRAGLRITADRPLSRMALWSIRAPLSVEPFIDMTVAPGAEFTWQLKYDYFSLSR